jgi:hypothetical protein
MKLIALMMETANTFKTSVSLHEITLRNIPENIVPFLVKMFIICHCQFFYTCAL